MKVHNLDDLLESLDFGYLLLRDALRAGTCVELSKIFTHRLGRGRGSLRTHSVTLSVTG